MQTAGPADAGPAPALSGERKPVTILFCDIVGSTGLAARLGPDRMHALVNEFLEVSMGCVRRHDGDVNQFLGDGFMALFGAPVSREDHALCATLAALDMRDLLAGRRWRALPDGEVLQARIGMHAGTVVFGAVGDGQRREVTAIGDAANVAARLQSEAPPGGIVCSEAVCRAVRDHVRWRSLGARVLRGKAGPIEVFELIERGPDLPPRRVPGALSAVRGRDEETAALLRALDGLQAGRGALVTLAGDAGLGKSRLLDFAHAVAVDRGIACVRGGGVSHGRGLAYRPFREVFGAVLRVDLAPQAAGPHALDAALGDLLGEAAPGARPFVAALLGMRLDDADARRVAALDGQAVGHQIFRTCVRLIEAITARRGLAILLDDWQWADESSAALLHHLVPLAARLPLTLVVAGRPDPRGAFVALAQSLRGPVTPQVEHRRVVLAPLQEAAMQDVLRRAFGGAPAHPALARQLLGRAAGNPFYLEELVRTLRAAGTVERSADDGVWRAVGRGEEIVLPDSIEGVILERIDRLGGRERLLLRIAAVIGRRFDRQVLAAVAGDGGGLDAELDALVDAGLLADPGESGQAMLAFHHPLIQEAAYGSLVDADRRALHRRVAECLAQRSADRLESVAPELALHFLRAEQWSAAREHLLRAGEEAGRIAADAEALECFESALRAAQAAAHGMDVLDRTRLAARMAQALYRRGRNDAALDHALAALAALGFSYPTTRTRTRAAIAGKVAARAARWLGAALGAGTPRRARPADEAHRIARDLFEVVGTIDYFLEPERFVLGILTMLEEAERRPPSRALAISTSALALICDAGGMYRLGAGLHRRAVAAAERLDEDLARGYCNHMLGLHQYATGRWREALDTLGQGRMQLDRAGHLRLWASCTGASYFVLRSMGDARWIDLAEEQFAVAESTGDAHARAWAINARGVACLYRGDPAGALPLFEEASAAYERIPDHRFLAGALARRGLCQALAGRTDIAIGLVERSRQLVDRHRIAGTSASAPLLAAAEAWLAIVERLAAGGRRDRALRQAAAACARASAHARGVGDESAAEALRLAGVRAWLAGDAGGARRDWLRAIARADALGAGYVRARAHHDLATRLDAADHAGAAAAGFARAGAAPYAR
ncbi:MAG: AAA family ATPase [Burkholderiales bacterium]|nr:AAA family ATPase [Burkholderiales bacterium]